MENEVGDLIRAIDTDKSHFSPIEDEDSDRLKASKMLAQYPYKARNIAGLGEKLRESIASYGKIRDGLDEEVLALWEKASGHFQLRNLCAHGHWYQPLERQLGDVDFDFDEAFGVVTNIPTIYRT